MKSSGASGLCAAAQGVSCRRKKTSRLSVMSLAGGADAVLEGSTEREERERGVVSLEDRHREGVHI